MGSRMLLSFPFLLAGMLALSSVAVAQSSINCVLLDPEKDHLQQMVDCRGDTFDFKNNENKKNGFKLSGLDQDTADKIFYQLDLDGKLDKNRPRKFDADITIENSFMETLAMAFEPGRNHKAVIRNNKLVDFRIRPDPKKTTSVELEVRGNKQLSMGSIYKLSKVPRLDLTASKIQHFQECFFDSKPLGSLAELEGCSGVEGDLVIDSSTNTANIPSTLRIAEIRDGCLRIDKSKLTNLKFLEGLLDSRSPKTCSDQSQNRYIKENSQLCLTSEEQIRWENYKLTYVGTCDDRCSADFASTNPTKPCQIVTGDVKITGNVDPTKLEHWDRVTVLEGTLEVDNTDLAEIEIFKKLKEIKNPSKFKRALAVTRNSKMEKFNLPKLKSITQQPDAWQGPVLFHQNNPAFKLSWPEYEKWQNITREDNPQIPSVARPIKPTTPSPPGSTTLSQKQIRDKNKSIKEANEQTYYYGNVAMWFTGVVIALLIIGAIAFVIWRCCWDRLCRCFRRCCCKKRKAHQEGHDADHGIKEPKKPAGKKEGAVRRTAPSKGKRDIEKDELTVAVNSKEYELPADKDRLFTILLDSYQEHEYAMACQMARDAVEIPFKMSNMITNVNAVELDFNRVPPPTTEEKTSPKFYRFEQQKSQWLAYNPRHINNQPPQRMEKFDPHAVLKILLTNCNEFFLTNYHLLPDTIKYLSGPYYSGKSKNLLGKIDGPVTLATDIHSMLDTLQVILNIDLDKKNDNKPKVHPAFRQKYVFLGDYVDRGHLGLECSILLCLLARLFPGNFVILRGNHDQQIVPLELELVVEHTINKFGEALAKKMKKSKNAELKYPHHFADCMYLDYVDNVVAHMPYACLINGKVFACHGGVSLTMLQMTGTLDELFGKLPVPYLEKVYNDQDSYDRLFDEPNPLSQMEEKDKKDDIDEEYEKLTMTKKCSMYYEENEENKDDKFVKELARRKDDLRAFVEGITSEGEKIEGGGYEEYKEKKKADKEKKKKKAEEEKKEEKAADKEKKEEKAADFVINPKFEVRHPWVYELAWSEPGPSLALYGNTRGAGNTYSYDNVTEFCQRFGIDYIVRGHTMKFTVSPDGKLVNIYSNPYHVVYHQKVKKSEPQKTEPEPMELGCFASILRINPDGTQMFVFIRLDWEKERDQAVVKKSWKIRREVGTENRTKIKKQRKKEWDLAKGQEQGETKKTDENKAGQQSPEGSKSAPEKKASQSTPEKKSSQSIPEKKASQSTPEKKSDADKSTRKKKSVGEKSTRKKKSKKSEAEKITDKSPASGQEGKSPMRKQTSNKPSNNKK